MSDSYQIWRNLIENPHAPRFYRELRDHYARLGRCDEADAINHLLEEKFGETDRPPADPEQ